MVHTAQMFFGRLFLALSTCLFLTNCSLINTALRLAPYLLMMADENGQPRSQNGQLPAVEQRALEVEQRGHFAPGQQRKWATAGSQMASR